MITPPPPLPFLIDFGAVKEAIATEVNHNSASTYSASIGTPGYMSSEQAAGRPIYSSDLYSLGLTAIFLLTGQAPHELETDPRNGEIIWREWAKNVDPELADIIDRSIKFHPRDRFSSAREMLDALKHNLVTSGGDRRSATLNLAPKAYASSGQVRERANTVAFAPRKKHPRKKSLLSKVALFLLVATGVAAGTFTAGFVVVSNLWRSPDTPSPTEVETARQPNIFDNSDAEESELSEAELEAEAKRRIAKAKAAAAKKKREREIARTAEIELNKPPKPKAPKTLAQVDFAPADEVDIPILTTGTDESQLVSTLGKPSSQRRGWQPNSKVLVYYDVIPDRVNLSYQSDDTGKIRQTDIALNQSVSLGAMQQTLSRMLGREASADIKAKVRSVYNREANFSFFKIGNLEGKVQRDSRDRINLSVWDKGFQ